MKAPAPDATRLLQLAALAVLLVASALAVTWSVHQSRALTGEQQELQAEQDRLQMEWGQLQLEYSTWGSYPRVERLAREELEMRLPGTEDRVVIRP